MAAGVEATGLRDIMGRLDLTRVPDRLLPGLLVLSQGASLFGRRGAYRGEWIRQWLVKELAPWPATRRTPPARLSASPRYQVGHRGEG
ncbi:hypothetical protein ACIBAG_35910 [Streptomyces sp. NPDC051243]|uniref:hypothetical protein n=1 Tax=Streptomyces sp. NPDC051243 TaxID=3365646 RepID=UPI0037A0AB39